MAFSLEIVTPEKEVYADTVESVTLPTAAGEIEVLPGHVPLLSVLETGEIRVVKLGEKESIAVDKGFVKVQGDVVTVLTEAAIDVKDVDLSAVEKAESKAIRALEEARKQKDVDPAEIERLESITRFSVAQKIAKNKYL